MSIIRIVGGKPLYGEVTVSGSKNAALPMLFASIITDGTSVLRKAPRISDIAVAEEILLSLGATVSECGNTVKIDTTNLSYSEIPSELTRRIRASTYLLGATLSRFGVCKISDFGGCGFSQRPIDMHIAACEAFGGRIKGNEIIADRLRGTEIRLKKRSVGATINAIILASSAIGESKIYGYAREPHVLALADFLISAGAEICFDEEKIRINGARLHGADTTVIGDMIEAGTYLAAAAATGGRVTVKGCRPDELSAFVAFLRSMGAYVEADAMTVLCEGREIASYSSVICEEYPGFPTDLQPIAGVLMTKGGGKIIDRVWPERYGYLDSLAPLGIRYAREYPGVRILKSNLSAGTIVSPDLRGGAAAVVAALSLHGKSVIERAEYILRGYEDIDYKFASLGADIMLEM